jgi:hypothetical protein
MLQDCSASLGHTDEESDELARFRSLMSACRGHGIHPSRKTLRANLSPGCASSGSLTQTIVPRKSSRLHFSFAHLCHVAPFHLLILPAHNGASPGGLLPPSPPAEKSTASQDQAGQASADDRANSSSILRFEPCIDNVLCLGNNRLFGTFLKRCGTFKQRR